MSTRTECSPVTEVIDNEVDGSLETTYYQDFSKTVKLIVVSEDMGEVVCPLFKNGKCNGKKPCLINDVDMYTTVIGTAIQEKINPELAKNPNYLAYKEQEAKLKEEHMGSWVGFINGEMVAVRESREQLFAIVRKEHPNKGFFFKEITPTEDPVDIGGTFLTLS
jgi:hypothetical protein